DVDGRDAKRTRFAARVDLTATEIPSIERFAGHANSNDFAMSGRVIAGARSAQRFSYDFPVFCYECGKRSVPAVSQTFAALFNRIRHQFLRSHTRSCARSAYRTTAIASISIIASGFASVAMPISVPAGGAAMLIKDARTS